MSRAYPSYWLLICIPIILAAHLLSYRHLPSYYTECLHAFQSYWKFLCIISYYHTGTSYVLPSYWLSVCIPSHWLLLICLPIILAAHCALLIILTAFLPTEHTGCSYAFKLSGCLSVFLPYWNLICLKIIPVYAFPSYWLSICLSIILAAHLPSLHTDRSSSLYHTCSSYAIKSYWLLICLPLMLEVHLPHIIPAASLSYCLLICFHQTDCSSTNPLSWLLTCLFITLTT